MADTKTGTHITQVGVAMVPVTDQDRAIEFYTQKLGLELRSDTPFGDGNRWVEVAPAGAQTRISLVVPPDGEGQSTGVEAGVAFSTNDVDADHAELRSRGVDVDAEIMRMGDPVPPMFWFRDQDGNRLLIVQDQT